MDFLEVETEEGTLLINIWEIVYISEFSGNCQIKMKGSPITLSVSTSIENIKEQLNGPHDDPYGISYGIN